MRKAWLLIAAIGLLVAGAAPVGAAPPGYEHVYSEEVAVEELSPGTMWHSGRDDHVEHMRGWEAVYQTYGRTHEYMSGTIELEVNWNRNDAAWSGNLWGSARYISDTYDASGWHTTFSGQYTEPGAWEGRGVGSGYGAFDGMKFKFDVRNVPGVLPPADTVDGYVFTPGSR